MATKNIPKENMKINIIIRGLCFVPGFEKNIIKPKILANSRKIKVNTSIRLFSFKSFKAISLVEGKAIKKIKKGTIIKGKIKIVINREYGKSYFLLSFNINESKKVSRFFIIMLAFYKGSKYRKNISFS
jgi:hypothetical protein